jgi:CHAD domain-containing protein
MTNQSTKNAALIQSSVAKTIEKLRLHLTEPETGSEYIHRIRVEIKHLRAWLRLLRITTDTNDWKSIDQKLRDTAKSLSGARDAQVIKDTLSILYRSAKNKPQRLAIDYFQASLEPQLITSQIIWPPIKNELSNLLNIIEAEFVTFESISSVRNGLRLTYKKSIRLGKAAFSKNNSRENLHQLRKWVKYLYYQLSYLDKAYPDYIKARHRLDVLGDNLGTINDLFVFKERLNQAEGIDENTDNLELVSDLIDKNIERIIKKSTQNYKAIFKTSAKEFIHYI